MSAHVEFMREAPTSARDRYGLLIELTANYPSTYGTVLQTDVTCELCRALFVAYPPAACQ